MKCKKIFAMLLALCMIASTFVAVSAKAFEGTIAMSPSYKKIITEDDGAYSFTTKDVAANVSSAAWASQFCVAFVPTTPIEEGTGFTVSFDLLTDGVLNSAGNLYEEMTVYARLIDNTGDYATQGNTIGLIGGNVKVKDGKNVHLEFDSIDMVKSLDSIKAQSTKTTIKKICIVINVDGACKGYNKEANDGAFTISNIAVAEPLEAPEPVYDAVYETVVNMTKTMDDADTGLLTAKKVTDFEYKDGIAFANLTSADGDSMVGFMLVDEDGKGYTIKKGDVIEYSALIKPSKTFKTRYGNAETAGIFIRSGTSYVPADKTFSGIHPIGDVPGGDWVTLSGKWTCDRDYLNSTYFNIRPNTIMTLEVDEVTVTVKKEVIPDITNIKLKSVTADSATFTVKTDGRINSRSIKNYCEIDGEPKPSNEVLVNTQSETEIEVTVTGLTPGLMQEFRITGAKSWGGSDVTIDCNDTVEFQTLYEVGVAAEVDEKVTYTLTNNMGDDVDVHAVLLRCKDNTVIETKAHALEIADEVSGEFEVDPLANGEYFRFFVWSYDGAIRSLAELKDLK